MPGIFIGRMSPAHIGHQAVIEKMISENGIEQCRVFFGSAGKDISIRNLFTYEQRVLFVQTLYPGLTVAPIPDFSTDREWLKALDDLTRCSGFDPKDVVFYGGCQEDVEFLIEDKRNTTILNRFDGSTPEISATKIRDFLIARKPITEWVDPRIDALVIWEFEKNWEILKRK